MTLLVAGVLLGVGVPNVMEMQRNGAMTAAANDLVTATLMARAEAVRRQAFTALCLSPNPLDDPPACSPIAVTDSSLHGVIVWLDENGNGVLTDPTDGNATVDPGEPVLMRVEPQGEPMRVSTNCGHVSYGPSGFPREIPNLCPPPVDRTLLFCDDRGRRIASGSLSSARIVTIDPLGRGQVFQDEATVNTRIADTPGTCP